jgi:hypothetical protein
MQSGRANQDLGNYNANIAEMQCEDARSLAGARCELRQFTRCTRKHDRLASAQRSPRAASTSSDPELDRSRCRSVTLPRYPSSIALTIRIERGARGMGLQVASSGLQR